MKKDFDCDKCELTNVCYEKRFVDEYISKVKAIENDIYTPEPFGYSMQCYHYFTKEDWGY